MSINTTDPMIGRLIDGRYQVRSRIARGGMATVYLATDLRLERPVAIKIMHGHLADDSKFKERFIQEARSAARLAHPNVVNVFDQGQDAESAYLVMEYLPGITLRDLLQEYGTLTTEQTLDIVDAVLSGLAAAHKAGIVHRDLKPENVLLADDGRIKIGDFGLARAASANTVTGAALLGTIAYLSPELVTRGVADTRSDIYAVGIMMYEMLAGEQPYKGEQPMQIAYQHANDSVPTPSTKNPRVPAELDELVLWATAREPAQRPRDARVMLEQLHETQNLLQTALPTGTITTQKTTVMPSAPTPVPDNSITQMITPRTQQPSDPQQYDSIATLSIESQKRRRRGWGWFVTIVVLIALAGGAGLYFGVGPGSQVTIPRSIKGMSMANATSTLESLGLTVLPSTGLVYDPVIAANTVAGSSPNIGTPFTKATPVKLLLSKGPKPFALGPIIGQTQDAAEKEISTHWTLTKKITQQFSDSVKKGTVIDALDASGKSLAGVTTYGDQQPISLIVSAGSLPAVSGLSFDAAQSALKAVNLQATQGAFVYNNSIPANAVIGIVTTASDGKTPLVIQPGGSVVLSMSQGHAPVTVPNVVGQSWTTAKSTLSGLGFTLKYPPNGDKVPSTVASTNPPAGSTVDYGSTISVVFVNPNG